MTRLGLALVLAASLGALAGCAAGAPKRASDIQNVHGISDDISATTMTESQGMRANDPNQRTTFPRNYQTYNIP